MNDFLKCLEDAGLTAEEITATDAANPANWDIELVKAAVADFDDPANTARRAARAAKGGQAALGTARAEKIANARRAWLAAAQ